MLGLLMSFLARVATKWISVQANKAMVGTVADAVVDRGIIKAHADSLKYAAEIRKADQQSLWTAWMLPTAFFFAVLHFGAVVLDSIPLFGHKVGSWRIAELPGLYREVQIAIIYSVAGVTSVSALTSVLKRFLVKG